MKNVIAHGKIYKEIKCPVCGCMFSCDSISDYRKCSEGVFVTCPECDTTMKTELDILNSQKQ